MRNEEAEGFQRDVGVYALGTELGNGQDGNGGKDPANTCSKKEQYRYGLEVLSSVDVAGTLALLCKGAAGVGERRNTMFHAA